MQVNLKKLPFEIEGGKFLNSETPNILRLNLDGYLLLLSKSVEDP